MARAQQALSTLGLDRATPASLDKAAQTLGPTPGDLFDLVNLGEVTPEVATASGYGCLGG
jgi:hypothetical protein